MRIYVATSWRNHYQPEVVRLCREAGHETYDFRNPAKNAGGFHWSEVDESWKSWDFERYRDALTHPVAEHGFRCDMDALEWCDACLLVYPCGKSAHLELGWACGTGRKTAALFPTDIAHPEGFAAALQRLRRAFEAELMVKMAGEILIGRDELANWLT